MRNPENRKTMPIMFKRIAELYGCRLSRGGKTIVKEALDSGLEPVSIIMSVSRAAQKARENGHCKVGPFGQCVEIFNGLRTEVLRRKELKRFKSS